MSKAHSPTHFNGETDNFFEPNFTDINKRMQVPKSIRVTGNEEIMNQSVWNQMSAVERFEMHVPDRIVVIGKIIF